MVLGLILYLIGLTQWGRTLRDDSATMRRRRLCGFAAALLPVVVGLISVMPLGIMPTETVAFTLGWSGLVGFLGYLAVAHCPKWIVGKFGQSDAERKMEEARQRILRNLKT